MADQFKENEISDLEKRIAKLESRNKELEEYILESCRLSANASGCQIKDRLECNWCPLKGMPLKR